MSKRLPIPEFTAQDKQDFWSKTKTLPDGCIIWTGQKNNYGYGMFQYKGVRYLAHRVAYTWTHGPIPDHLELDHLCGNRLCLNPDHLEAVTHRENILRGESPSAKAQRGYCQRGHEFSGDNIIISDGRRHCKACQRLREKEWHQAHPGYLKNYYQTHKEDYRRRAAKYRAAKALSLCSDT